MINHVKAFLRKRWLLLRNNFLGVFFGTFFIIFFRAIKPFFEIRLGILLASRIGHFAANTELYLCEANLSQKKSYIDIFCLNTNLPSNFQLLKMWRRELKIWPIWIISAIKAADSFWPGPRISPVPQNAQEDRDVLGLFDVFSPHLSFTEAEKKKGEVWLKKNGIPDNAKFICLTVRDSAYLKTEFPNLDSSYHNYRDSDIAKYELAAQWLADKGYFVFRMGAKVLLPLGISHPRIIDYATNGMRDDFMDIYLGAHCHFCITQGTGFDAIPVVFRRPLLQVNAAPLGYSFTYLKDSLILSKHHIDIESGKRLTLREIFSRGVGFSLSSSEFMEKGVELKENDANEILEAVVEMVERLDGEWESSARDEERQQKFWHIFPKNAVDKFTEKPLHGTIKARFASFFLREGDFLNDA